MSVNNDNSANQAYTSGELREQFLNQVRAYASYWADIPDKTAQQRCDGLAFSLMNLLDGSSPDLPAFDVVARPHPDDKAYCLSEGRKYIQNGTIVNFGTMLHEQYYQR